MNRTLFFVNNGLPHVCFPRCTGRAGAVCSSSALRGHTLLLAQDGRLLGMERGGRVSPRWGAGLALDRMRGGDVPGRLLYLLTGLEPFPLPQKKLC